MHSLDVIHETFLVVLKHLIAEVTSHSLRLLLHYSLLLLLSGLQGRARHGLLQWDAGARDCRRHGDVVHLDVHKVGIWNTNNIYRVLQQTAISYLQQSPC